MHGIGCKDLNLKCCWISGSHFVCVVKEFQFREVK